MNQFSIKPEQQNRRSIVRIASCLGCKVMYGDETMKETGLVELINEGTPEQKIYILLKPGMSVSEQRLTIAHELAHLILGHLLPCFNGSGEQAEFEAESLAFMLYSYIYNPFYQPEPKTNDPLRVPVAAMEVQA